MMSFIASVLLRTASTSAARIGAAVTTANRQGWRLVLDGAVIAASRIRSSSARSIAERRRGRCGGRATIRGSWGHSFELEPPVDVPDLASHVACFIAAEECDHARHFL